MYNTYLAIVDRYSKNPIFLPCHKDDTALNTALLLWNGVISHTLLFKNIISEGDLQLKFARWTSFHILFGTKLSFSTAYHPQINGLEERIIQALEHIIGIFCAYVLGLKDSDVLTNHWCTQIPALELKYKTLVHYYTGQTPAMIEKGWNQILPEDTLRKDLIEINPTVSRFKIMLDSVKHHAKQSMNYTFDYAKQKWDKIHRVPDFKVGNLVLVSTLNFNNLKCPKKLKDSYLGHLFNIALHGNNSFQVDLSGESEKKHLTFLVRLINLINQLIKNCFL
ncbi:hypothetical protein O181_065773 [Austropuccinia psidii MF-1]|uniref:Integrase catalytic domain-containing protein n=1 Tax=Austropuccinia psidii MF-1 TaxID=1389203 RepID=A0A9Q3I2Y1_9BASI|nr:hypothetical protein [Austropuccinia psidii MF-1]